MSGETKGARDKRRWMGGRRDGWVERAENSYQLGSSTQGGQLVEVDLHTAVEDVKELQQEPAYQSERERERERERSY